jgi:hypothetical protein
MMLNNILKQHELRCVNIKISDLISSENVLKGYSPFGIDLLLISFARKQRAISVENDIPIEFGPA